MDSLIIYGFGLRGKSLYSALNSIGVEIKCVIDGNRNNWNRKVDGIAIVSPDILNVYTHTSICITVANIQEKSKIRKEIKEKYAFSGEEYDFFDLIFDAYKKMYYSKRVMNIQTGDKNKRKILFDCCHGLVMGGIELWTKELCLELMDRGWKHLRIVCDDEEYCETKEIMDIVDKVYIDHHKDYGKETFWSMIHYLENQIPFVVVTSFPDVVLMAACILKERYPSQVNIISVIHHGEDQFYRANIKFKTEVDKYIGVSEDIKREMIRRGAGENQVLSMTCPIQCDKYIEREYSMSVDAPIRIGYAGRLVIYKKRMDLLLKMIEMLNNLEVNYQIQIAGEGSAKEMMENFVNEHFLDDKVIFKGVIERERIPEFWKQQDICVNIADCEGRCISKMEGMAGGAVPIVTDVAGSKEDINDGENGYIISVGDYKAMAEKISYLAAHRALVVEMGKRAHDSIFPKCQMSEHIVFWEEILASYGLS